MGSGSSAEVNAHLKKWDSAMNDLSSLCRDHRRTLDNPTPTNDGHRSDTSRETESHTLLKKGGAHVSPPGEENDEVQSERSLRRRTSSLVSFGKDGKKDPEAPQLVSPKGRDSHRTSLIGSPQDGTESPHPGKHKNRQQVIELKKARRELFKSYVDVPLDTLEHSLACSHFAIAAVALSDLLGGHRECEDRKKRVTVEDLFFSAQIPLHMLHNKDCSLSAMYDILKEFIDVDNRFKNNYSLEAVFLDIAPTRGQVDIGNNDVGDRQARLELPEFRKMIVSALEENHDSVFLLNYDPFIVEQAMFVDEDGDPSDDGDTMGEEALRNSFSAAVSPVARGKKPSWHQQKYKKENNGQFAVLMDSRVLAVQPMITVAEAAVDSKLHVAMSEVPLAAMYKAMRNSQPGKRSRGFIKISKRDSGPASSPTSAMAGGLDEVPYMFTPELCSGKVLGSLTNGTHAHLVSEDTSAHIIAVGWALHLLAGPRPDCHGYGSGLPISDIITTLKMPSDVFLSCPLPLDQVHLYTQEYLKAKRLDTRFAVQLCPILTKISREDAVPTVSVFDLEAILIEVKNSNEDAEQPDHIMIIQYSADIAHNALRIADTPQWAILAGYDEDNQVARLIDANPNRFCASWTIPLDRLHKAITNFGYLVISNTAAGSRNRRTVSGRSSISENSQSGPLGNGSPAVGGLRHVTSTVQQRLDLLDQQGKGFGAKDVFQYFTYPKNPTAITQLAVSLTKLGMHTTVEDIVHTLPYDVSSLTAPSIGLQSFLLVTNEYLSRKGFAEKVVAKAMHADRDDENVQGLPMVKFTNLLKGAANSADRDDVVMIVHYARTKISVFGANQPMGEYGIVTGFNEETGLVTLSDVNPNRFFRSWQVSVTALHEAVLTINNVQHRSRGIILMKKVKKPEEVPQIPARYRDYHLMLVPVQQVFHVSPSPQMQGLSMACAQLGFSFSPEEIFYEAYLKTMSDQRRRGSQAFAWRDVEVSLGMVNKRITAHIMALVFRKFLESRKIYTLGAEVVDDVDTADIGTMLKEATEITSDHILLLNYQVDVAHGLQGFGNSVALIQSYSPETNSVGFYDAEYTLFGLQWTASVDTMIEAGDLDNVGRSDFGFVKIFKKETNDENRLGGKGFNAFVGSPADIDKGDRSKSPKPTFT